MKKVEAKNALENYAFNMRNTIKDDKVQHAWQAAADTVLCIFAERPAPLLCPFLLCCDSLTPGSLDADRLKDGPSRQVDHRVGCG